MSIVVLWDPDDLRWWQRRCLEQLVRIDGVEVVGAVRPGAAATAAHGAKRSRGIGVAKGLRTRLLPPAMKKVPPPEWMESLPWRACAARMQGRRESFDSSDLDWVRSLRPDLVLRFGFGFLVGSILQSAPAGVWSFHHGDLEQYRGRPPVFWEMLNGESRVGITLQRLTETLDGGNIVARGYVPVVPWSPRKTAQRLYECSPVLLRRALLQLREQGTVHCRPADGLGRLYRPPRVRDVLGCGASVARASAKWAVEKAFYEFDWRIGRLCPAPPLEGETELAPEWIEGPKAGFYADPCAAPDGDETVLVEHYEVARRKGRIDALELSGATPAPSRVVLDLPEHLSFPQIYRVDGRIWLVPETAGHGRQLASELDGRLTTKAAGDPATVAGVTGVDPVFFERNGYWWALASPGGSGGSHLLNAYYSTDFLGPYLPHAANPVVVDPQGARPAGAMIERDGRLIRFGQVFGRRYGEGIDVFEVVSLSPFIYEERRVGQLRLKRSGREVVGTHGIAVFPWGAVVDGYTLRVSPFAGVRRVRGWLGARLGRSR